MLETLLLISQIVFLENILSMDNALALATLVSHLPKNKPIELHGPFKLLNRFIPKTALMQQQLALKVGLLGAYLGRGIMLVFATIIMHNKYLKILGALYLLHLAFEHLGEMAHDAEGYSDELTDDIQRGLTSDLKITKGKKKPTFWRTVLTVELMDLMFSLDNVVAIAALSNHIWILILGVALGILIMRFFASHLILLVEKMPSLGVAAYILILNIAIEMFVATIFNIHITESIKFSISLITILLAVIFDKYYKKLSSKAQKSVFSLLYKIGILMYKVNYWLSLQWINANKGKIARGA